MNFKPCGKEGTIQQNFNLIFSPFNVNKEKVRIRASTNFKAKLKIRATFNKQQIIR